MILQNHRHLKRWRFICSTIELWHLYQGQTSPFYLFFIINIVQNPNHTGAVKLNPAFRHHCFLSLEVAGQAWQMLSSSPNPAFSEEAPLHNYISLRLKPGGAQASFPN